MPRHPFQPLSLVSDPKWIRPLSHAVLKSGETFIMWVSEIEKSAA
jgi:hypothetical protein